MKISAIVLGAALRKSREARNLSQKELAARMRTPRTYLSKLERGLSTPTLDNLCRIADALGIEPWKIVRHVCRQTAIAEGGKK